MSPMFVDDEYANFFAKLADPHDTAKDQGDDDEWEQDGEDVDDYYDHWEENDVFDNSRNSKVVWKSLKRKKSLLNWNDEDLVFGWMAVATILQFHAQQDSEGMTLVSLSRSGETSSLKVESL